MAINAKRLLKLADYLETVPRKQFDMGMFGDVRECGFAGCALGWAGHGKLFRGFSYTDRFRINGIETPGFEAARELFSIPSAHSLDLFAAHRGHETPKQVAKRIRKFVRDNQASAP